MEKKTRIACSAFAIIIALLILLGVILWCPNTEEFEITESEIGGLVAIQKQSYFVEGYDLHQFILYDPDTLVMYVVITRAEGVTISVLYNADGTPKLYNP